MKKNGLDEEIDYKKKDEIEKAYELFESQIKKNYFISGSFLDLLNPFNYISFEDYSSAYNKDSNSCFFAQYENEIKKIDEIVSDEVKQN